MILLGIFWTVLFPAFVVSVSLTNPQKRKRK